MKKTLVRNRRLLGLLAGLAGLVLVVVLVVAALLYTGVVLINNPSREDYPVRGVDVSAWQGEIDWAILASHGVDFAFIKATEGSSYVDEFFQDNYVEAAAHLRVSAYHFFSFDSPGATQAENYIATVPIVDDMLPPVIDLEFYGDKQANPPERSLVDTEMADLLDALETHYGCKPIIYATEISYATYLADGYSDYDVWIADVYGTPDMPDGRAWTFWQYTNRERLTGYTGDEPFIDMNVFSGDEAEFEAYGCS